MAQFCGNHPPEMHKDLITCDSFSEISNSSCIKHSPCSGHDQTNIVLFVQIFEQRIANEI